MDEMTRLTLRVIELENQKPARQVAFDLEKIDARIRILEEARLRQIAFNSTVVVKTPAKAVMPDNTIIDPWARFREWFK